MIIVGCLVWHPKFGNKIARAVTRKAKPPHLTTKVLEATLGAGPTSKLGDARTIIRVIIREVYWGRDGKDNSSL